MARGWESKSVESQIESAESRRPPVEHENAELAARRQETASLELSRTRIRRELAAATNPRYRQTLEAALQYLDEKIAKLA